MLEPYESERLVGSIEDKTSNQNKI